MMTSLALSGGQNLGNPIDLAEEIVQANQWAHDRASDEELLVEIAGRWSDYRLLFLWQRDIAALHFSCSFDMKVPKARRGAVLELLVSINERLWLGHFDLVSNDLSPAFRQGVLLRGAGGALCRDRAGGRRPPRHAVAACHLPGDARPSPAGLPGERGGDRGQAADD